MYTCLIREYFYKIQSTDHVWFGNILLAYCWFKDTTVQDELWPRKVPIGHRKLNTRLPFNLQLEIDGI